MTLKVIGTGLGRTGTLSLKLALEQLGFGPCYHMLEVFPRPDHVALWSAALRGEPVDWERLFAGFAATVDWPSVHFWRELTARYPDAKVVHTPRAPEAWWASFSQTIAETVSGEGIEGPLRPWWQMARTLILERTFGGDLSRDNALRVYAAHNAEVARVIPPGRRLDVDVAQGWGPLCAFLGVPVPQSPFPKTNSTDEFRARAAAMRAMP